MKNILGVLLLCACVSAQAATVTFYTDRALFEAALSSSTTIDFEGQAPANSYVAYQQSFYDVNFTGSTLRVVDSNAAGFSGNPFQSDILAASYNSSVIEADLTSAGSGFTAAGGWFGVNEAGFTYTDDETAVLELTLVGGQTFTEFITAGNMHDGKPETFFGWTVVDGEISSISHDVDGGYWEAVDNFTYGIAAVPVPAAVWLFGSALGLLGWMRRKQTA